MSVIVKSGGGAAKQEKTVTAGTYVKEVLPDTGKLLSKVVVNPTPTEEKTVTPTTSQQTVSPSEGKHLSKVIVNAMEDVTPEATAQTPIIAEIIEGLVGKAQGATATADKILEGYSAYVNGKLVDGAYVPHGQYVWKKYDIETISYPQTTLTFTQQNVGGTPATLKVTCPDIDLTKVDASFFNGVSGTVQSTNQSYVFNNGVLTIESSTNLSFTYDASATSIYIDTSWGAITWGSTTIPAGEFIEYIYDCLAVSDNPSAYPDGGEQGGYWYEKVKDGLTPEVFGCTKMAIDKFSFTSDTASNGVDVYHSLGEKPKIIMLICSTPISSFSSSYLAFMTVYYGKADSSGIDYYYGMYRMGGSTDSQAWSMIFRANKNYCFSNVSNRNYKAGEEYTLITMA